MLPNAIGRVDLAVLGLAHLRITCPVCARETIRLFDAGEVQACRACARPSVEHQVASFLEVTDGR
jgi:hypothetical protein